MLPGPEGMVSPAGPSAGRPRTGLRAVRESWEARARGMDEADAKRRALVALEVEKHESARREHAAQLQAATVLQWAKQQAADQGAARASKRKLRKGSLRIKARGEAAGLARHASGAALGRGGASARGIGGASARGLGGFSARGIVAATGPRGGRARSPEDAAFAAAAAAQRKKARSSKRKYDGLLGLMAAEGGEYVPNAGTRQKAEAIFQEAADRGAAMDLVAFRGALDSLGVPGTAPKHTSGAFRDGGAAHEGDRFEALGADDFVNAVSAVLRGELGRARNKVKLDSLAGVVQEAAREIRRNRTSGTAVIEESVIEESPPANGKSAVSQPTHYATDDFLDEALRRDAKVEKFKSKTKSVFDDELSAWRLSATTRRGEAFPKSSATGPISKSTASTLVSSDRGALGTPSDTARSPIPDPQPAWFSYARHRAALQPRTPQRNCGGDLLGGTTRFELGDLDAELRHVQGFADDRACDVSPRTWAAVNRKVVVAVEPARARTPQQQRGGKPPAARPVALPVALRLAAARKLGGAAPALAASAASTAASSQTAASSRTKSTALSALAASATLTDLASATLTAGSIDSTSLSSLQDGRPASAPEFPLPRASASVAKAAASKADTDADWLGAAAAFVKKRFSPGTATSVMNDVQRGEVSRCSDLLVAEYARSHADGDLVRELALQPAVDLRVAAHTCAELDLVTLLIGVLDEFGTLAVACKEVGVQFEADGRLVEADLHKALPLLDVHGVSLRAVNSLVLTLASEDCDTVLGLERHLAKAKVTLATQRIRTVLQQGLAAPRDRPTVVCWTTRHAPMMERQTVYRNVLEKMEAAQPPLAKRGAAPEARPRATPAAEPVQHKLVPLPRAQTRQGAAAALRPSNAG
ncbi:hypothetical protein M885DRAFT_613991 [Pelagophyceae sp. CCMP2097]|nr:hypothetical protein M885DRAFT_613991 [Pelagophyceae sp. CCMP2097]